MDTNQHKDMIHSKIKPKLSHIAGQKKEKMSFWWMTIILSLFIGVCSIIVLDFEENNLLRSKNSALYRQRPHIRFSIFNYLF